ncbi:MAG TPA: NAD+ synthase [Acidimicrobiaceae bacterium]|nr:NAD+ synthase [Acidimicrobiaceae bacterium]HCB37990.1 NAD+ synthase [Acidimicrobiaceae bacterium]
MRRLLVGLAQLNLRVGDLRANAAAIVAACRRAADDGAQLVVFSELAVTGYPPEDLLLKPAFLRAGADALAEIAAATGEVVAVVGFPELADEGPGAGAIFNAAAVCARGEVRAVYRKRLLPNYSVFDEQRYFAPGTEAGPLFEVDGVTVGVSICEDMWSPAGPLAAPLAEQVELGAQLLVSVNASPYSRGRQVERERQASRQAAGLGVPLVCVNQVGGQDDLVFDGGSTVTGADGGLAARLPAFEEAVRVVSVAVPIVASASAGASAAPSHQAAASSHQAAVDPWPDPTAEVWQALVVATRDYAAKNGFDDVVVGTSGGVDSSLVAAVAVDALGPDRVHAVSLPSRYSSDHSRVDAAALARNLGIDFRTIEIEPAHAALAELLSPGSPPSGSPSSGRAGDVGLTEQNLQSRIRGVVLMALSNRHGWLVLTTGNKTELSVGYSTLYGDTAGGFSVIKDCPKLLVYELGRWRNAQAAGDWIPESSLTKPPSAELSPGQRDDDHLPPYELLDPLVEGYVDADLTTEELVARAGEFRAGEFRADAELVRRITRLVDLAEYKRRQSPPGPRISAKSFGKDRRMPITNGFV